MNDQRDLLPDASATELEALSALDVADVPQEKWARSLVESIEVIEAAYVRAGVDADEAFRLASLAVRAVSEFRGGRQFYWPRGDALVTALRDAEIYRRANRSNIETLAGEFDLNVSQIYRICRQQRALHIRKVQGRLFDGEE
jgi:Mor family transcriptional regulator